jgi:hypothetical protein
MRFLCVRSFRRQTAQSTKIEKRRLIALATNTDTLRLAGAILVSRFAFTTNWPRWGQQPGFAAI